jgi:hypothetical protein
MRSISIRKLVVTVLVAGAALAAVTVAPAGAQAEKVDISPILECVFPLDGGQYVALWGYQNRFTNTDVAIGKDNFFAPGSENRGQPTAFKPGRNKGVFTTTFDGNDLTWTLTGITATANKDSERCKDNPVPVGSDSPQAVVLLGAVAGVIVLGGAIIAWFTKRRRRPATA